MCWKVLFDFIPSPSEKVQILKKDQRQKLEISKELIKLFYDQGPGACLGLLVNFRGSCACPLVLEKLNPFKRFIGLTHKRKTFALKLKQYMKYGTAGAPRAHRRR